MRALHPLMVEGSGTGKTAPRAETADTARVLLRAGEALAVGQPAALATVIETHGSTPATVGQKLVRIAPDVAIGTVGGGPLEVETLVRLDALLAEPADEHLAGRTWTTHLEPDLGMPCGGTVVLLLERLAAPHPVVVAGAGHVGATVAHFLALAGFAVTLWDERPGLADEARIRMPHDRCRTATGTLPELLAATPTHAALVVATHESTLDLECIATGLERGLDFVGGVGARRKRARFDEALATRGFPEADRARLRMPCGVDVGARTPEEIAIAIAAELVAWRRGRKA